MKITLATYSDTRYRKHQERLAESAAGEFDRVVSFTREQLEATPFYRRFKLILDQPRGSGYWLWKPYLILRCLHDSDDGDAVMYLDCGDVFSPIGIRGFLRQTFQYRDDILTAGVFPQEMYTKRDCFVRMGCDMPVFRQAIQLEAGVLAFKKTPAVLSFLDEWLTWCSDPDILTDKPNECGPNYPAFIDHRHDQSVLTNLAVKFNLRVDSCMRPFVTCNVNQET